MQQTPLSPNQGLKVLGHAVEILAQITDFITPASHQWPDTRLELAAGDRPQGPAQMTNRLGEMPGEQEAEDKGLLPPPEK